MCTADNLHSGILELACITPLDAVRHGIPDNSKILMTVSAHNLAVRLAVYPQPLFLSELNAAYAYTLAHSVNHLAFPVFDENVKIVEIRSLRRPKCRILHIQSA